LVIVVLISTVWSKKREYKYLIEKELRDKREEAYKKLIDIIYEVNANPSNQNNVISDKTISDMFEFSKDLTLWGSNEVIKKWARFRHYHKGLDNRNILLVLEDILFSIRKDMGHKKGIFIGTKLKEKDLLSLFINDTENIN